MSRTVIRLCKSCEQELPPSAPAQQKYCSSTCRERMKKRRTRLRRSTTEHVELQRLQAIEQRYDELQTHHRRLRQRLEDRDLKIRRLEHALRRADLQVEAAAEVQAQRTRAVRDELATANSEVATLRRNWSRKAAAADSTQEVVELRERLAAVAQRYESLVAKYRELSEAARYAATERKHLQGIVRQWDAMCIRLYKATGGRPKREADKKVLATWSRFRQLVRK